MFCLSFLVTPHAFANDAVVSYYGGGGPNECGAGRPCHGSRTACGQVFNMYRVSVAHKSLPCGTEVEFTNPENGEVLVAVVTDRGPYVRGREFDLSRAAAIELGFFAEGHTTLRYRIVAYGG